MIVSRINQQIRVQELYIGFFCISCAKELRQSRNKSHGASKWLFALVSLFAKRAAVAHVHAELSEDSAGNNERQSLLR